MQPAIAYAGSLIGINNGIHGAVTDDLKTQLQGLNLYLIGMMGAGKTTVGQVLAQQLGYQFFDTDAVIEQLAGQPITDLFAELGEADFRELETRVLSELSAYTRLAIATGGGIVTQQMNWSYLRNGLIVWLDVPLAQLQARLQADTTRPLLQQGDLAERLQTLLAQRRSLYAQADLHIEAGGTESPEQIANRILTLIPTVLKPAVEPPDYGN
jgi:shikimate kinase